MLPCAAGGCGEWNTAGEVLPQRCQGASSRAHQDPRLQDDRSYQLRPRWAVRWQGGSTITWSWGKVGQQ